MHPELFSLVLFFFVAAFTPGPNNILASYSGFNFGLKKSLPLILVFKKYPIIQDILKIVGSIFLIYLAYKISFSKNNMDIEDNNPVKFFETFLFQFINPKAVMVSIIVISTFVDTGENYMLTLIWVMVIIFIVALFSICFWTILGKFFKKFATNTKFIKWFNYVMSFLLLSGIATFYL